MKYRGFTLDPFQAESIEHLMNGDSVLVSAPTGTGKTIIADWIVEEALREGKKVIYTAPIKALSNQKFRDYCRLHGEDNVGLVTGDIVIRREAPIRIMTTEILRNMLLGGEPTDDLLAVVIDEVHFLDDPERGTVWEEVLIYLPATVQIVALSATLPNLRQFANWLTHVRERPVHVVTETTRAVPLEFSFAVQDKGLLSPDDFSRVAKRQGTRTVHDDSGRSGRGRGRGRDRQERGGGRDRRGRGGRRDSSAPHPIDIFKEIRRRRWLPLLYFVFSRQDTERYASQLAYRYQAELLEGEEIDRMQERLDAAAQTLGPVLTDRLLDMYRRGIAFHHAGLHVSLKALVEELYEAKLIKALFATSTFALGLNMPARTVVFHGLMKFNGKELAPLTTRGFMQKAGRAGRRGLDDVGHVIIRLGLEEESQFRQNLRDYATERYEPVLSRFSLSWNSVVNLLGQHELEQIRTIVNKSFLNYHLVGAARRQLARADQLESPADGSTPTKKGLKEARRLRNRAEQAEDLCFREFLRKRDFLLHYGYLDESGSFNAGAKLLRHIQIAELFTSELLLSGILETIDQATLFGLLVCMTTNLPRSVDKNYRLNRKDRSLLQEVELIRFSEVVVQGEQVSGMQVTWTPDLLPLGRQWAEGAQLIDLMRQLYARTDISGSLVSGFRRAIDLGTQIVQTYAEGGDPDRADELRDMLRACRRDEVEVVD